MEPGIFLRQHFGWELPNVQDINVDTPLGQLGITKLPNERGIFLSDMNLDRDPMAGNAEGNRTVGYEQNNGLRGRRLSVPGPMAVIDAVNSTLNF